MSDFTVIGIVGEILKELLRTRLSEAFPGSFSSPDSVTLLTPKDLETTRKDKLSIFLYQVTENAFMKNQPMERVGDGQLRHPPLSLNLYYLLTPFVKETDAIRGWDIHTILGRSMQVLYDNAILEGPALRDIFVAIHQEEYYEQIENIRIVLNPLSLDDLTKIWNSLDTPMKLSVGYEVRVVIIESTRRKEVTRIVEKNADYYQIKREVN